MVRHDVTYLSEFARFIENFLGEHPEVGPDRQAGRSMYWDKQVSAADIDSAQKDQVPIEGGYYYFGRF